MDNQLSKGQKVQLPSWFRPSSEGWILERKGMQSYWVIFPLNKQWLFHTWRNPPNPGLLSKQFSLACFKDHELTVTAGITP